MKKPLFNLHSTTDYNLFNFLDHNREIDQRNLVTIEKSILAHGLKTPLMVNSEGFITDGQHRFIVLQKNNLPVWYVVNNHSTNNDIEVMNNDRKDWKAKDRLHNQAKQGNLDCARILELTEDWEDDFNFMTVVDAYNATGKGSNTAIKNRQYKINLELGDAILNNCVELSEVLDNAKQSKFVRAMKKVMVKNDNFDLDHLIKNCYKRKLNIYNREGDIVKEIVEVYNYCKKKDLISE